jgi:hypothetical protein
VSIKKWFGKIGESKSPEPISVDDLIILQRFEEAEKLLKERLRKHSRDLPATLKLAKVYEATGRSREAIDQYVYAADRYTGEGFFDKAMALMSKAVKLDPLEGKLQLKLQRLERMRGMEQRLSAVMRALSRLDGRAGPAATTSYLELRRVWGELAVSDLIDRLDDGQLGLLLKVMELVKLGRNQVIAERGSRSEMMFLVTRGKVEATVKLPGGETTVLRAFEPGDLIGESTLLEHRPWPATYRTGDATVILKLDRAGLAAALQGNPDPRGLLDALREQRLDDEVAGSARKVSVDEAGDA